MSRSRATGEQGISVTDSWRTGWRGFTSFDPARARLPARGPRRPHRKCDAGHDRKAVPDQAGGETGALGSVAVSLSAGGGDESVGMAGSSGWDGRGGEFGDGIKSSPSLLRG